MAGAPRLATLSLHYPVHNGSAPSLSPIKDRASAITRLQLHCSELGYVDVEDIISALPSLREFKYTNASQIDEAAQPVPLTPPRWLHAQDVVRVLEPVRHQLHVLEINFEDVESRTLRFRRVQSLIAFSSLKEFKVDLTSIVSQNEINAFERFANRLPRSIERLIITGISATPGNSLVNFQGIDKLFVAALTGRLPRLKYLKLQPFALNRNSFRLDESFWRGNIMFELIVSEYCDVRDTRWPQLMLRIWGLTHAALALQEYLGCDEEAAAQMLSVGRATPSKIRMTFTLEHAQSWKGVLKGAGVVLETSELAWLVNTKPKDEPIWRRLSF